jgi:hypothetical protein
MTIAIVIPHSYESPFVVVTRPSIKSLRGFLIDFRDAFGKTPNAQLPIETSSVVLPSPGSVRRLVLPDYLYKVWTEMAYYPEREINSAFPNGMGK